MDQAHDLSQLEQEPFLASRALVLKPARVDRDLDEASDVRQLHFFQGVPILQEQTQPRPGHEEVRLEQPLIVQQRHPLPVIASAQQRGSHGRLAQDHGARRASRSRLILAAVIARARRALP